MKNQPIVSGEIERLGSKIHYWVYGQENQPLIVFTHGATLDHRMFEPQIADLVAHGYRVLIWDMRGHGISKPLGEKFDVRIVSDDLVAILNKLNCEQAYFFGHSFGGFVTQEIIFRYPERVKASGVIGCTDLSAKPSSMMRIAYKILPYILPLSSVKSFQKQTVAHLSEREAVKQYAMETTSLLSKEEFIKIILAGVECLGYDAGFGQQYTIQKPFLLTHGEKDNANGGIFTKSAPQWANKEPHCFYKVIPNAGHTANQDSPKAFNEVLLNFIKEHTA